MICKYLYQYSPKDFIDLGEFSFSVTRLREKKQQHTKEKKENYNLQNQVFIEFASLRSDTSNR
jgi:hypothetical protein